MKLKFTAAVAASMLALSGCGGSGDDSLGDQAAEQAEGQAENLEAMADNASGVQAEALQDRAESVEENGQAREEAIDESDVDAGELSDAQRNSLVNGQ